eukprot:CAMPEP_0194242422 /NCGR_PEP_ID=MMETSP0158-20130606/7956_1 /TAXON_ID=33649 /ORGANISM="Thalassionema nitzschioides, Strain L26-B" /LENGTH=232 /DNA_ID=CAMNT_0038977497 /DNA_START=27 /DNA_END=728 /DNA_ORIENTATION=-
MAMMMKQLSLLLLLVTTAQAFTGSGIPSSKVVAARASTTAIKAEEKGDEEQTTDVELFLSKKFPSFYNLLCKEDNIWKQLNTECPDGYTLFAPNEKAFENLGEKKLLQLADARNLEVIEKIGKYHVIVKRAVTKERLLREDWRNKVEPGTPRPFVVGGVQTMGGEVPVGRKKEGGFFGWGATEVPDTAVIGPNAQIVQSFLLGEKKDKVVHEMDALVSPELLWRYCDQLRIL